MKMMDASLCSLHTLCHKTSNLVNYQHLTLLIPRVGVGLRIFLPSVQTGKCEQLRTTPEMEQMVRNETKLVKTPLSVINTDNRTVYAKRIPPRRN